MTTLREAAQQALDAMNSFESGANGLYQGEFAEEIAALKAALEEYDKDRVKVEEMKANWALQRKLAEETQERDEQQREYEEQRLASSQLPAEPATIAEWWADKQRKPLTEEEIQAAWDSVDMRHPRGNETRIAFARAIERYHGIT